MQYEVLFEGFSLGMFKTREEAYHAAVNHIRTMKLMCGDIYIPYMIKEVKVNKRRKHV